MSDMEIYQQLGSLTKHRTSLINARRFFFSGIS
jgi:hypothetical protein